MYQEIRLDGDIAANSLQTFLAKCLEVNSVETCECGETS